MYLSFEVSYWLTAAGAKALAVFLCAYGVKSDGRKLLLHLAVGDKESTVCWKSFSRI